MKIKVRGGTARASDPALCESCSYRLAIKTERGDLHQFCTMYGERTRITQKVVECTHHYNKNLANLHEMKQIAWEIRTDTLGKIGFKCFPPDRKQSAEKRAERFNDVD